MLPKPDYKQLSDAQLVSALKTQDYVPAFTEIYDRYWPPLVLHVYRIVKEDDLAQDIVQELFTWIYQRSESLDITVSLSSYLYNAARHRVFNAIKHEKVKTNYLKSIADFDINSSYSADETIRMKELSALIASEIDKMPPKMREIFDLSRKKHLSHKEIASLLGISEHTVRTQIQRALKGLRSNPEIRMSLMILYYSMLN